MALAANHLTRYSSRQNGKNLNHSHFEKYFQHNYNRLFRFARSLLSNREEVEDVLAQTQYRILKTQTEVDLEDPENKKSYIYVCRIIQRLCIDLYRRERRWLDCIELDAVGDDEKGGREPADPRWSMDGYTKWETLSNALSDLPDDYSSIVTLHYLEGMTCKEIGEIIGLSDNGVRSKLLRARNILYQLLRDENHMPLIRPSTRQRR